MLKSAEIIFSEDFPEWQIAVKRPLASDWNDAQIETAKGNAQEAYLNILIACGTVRVVGPDGMPAGIKPPIMGEVVDEWGTLPEYAFGVIAEIAGGWAEGANAVRLNLPSILAAADRVLSCQAQGAQPSDADLALAKLAERCAAYGMDRDVMRAAVASYPRRGSFVAYLIDDIGAYIFTRPKFAAWSNFDSMRRKDPLAASVELTSRCTAFPERGIVDRTCGDLPAFATCASAAIIGLRNDIRQEVKKDVKGSAAPAETLSTPPAV